MKNSTVPKGEAQLSSGVVLGLGHGESAQEGLGAVMATALGKLFVAGWAEVGRIHPTELLGVSWVSVSQGTWGLIALAQWHHWSISLSAAPGAPRGSS